MMSFWKKEARVLLKQSHPWAGDPDSDEEEEEEEDVLCAKTGQV